MTRPTRAEIRRGDGAVTALRLSRDPEPDGQGLTVWHAEAAPDVAPIRWGYDTVWVDVIPARTAIRFTLPEEPD